MKILYRIFVCPHCGYEFTIHNFWIWLLRPHLFDKWRYNRCPDCKTWRWMKGFEK